MTVAILYNQKKLLCLPFSSSFSPNFKGTISGTNLHLKSIMRLITYNMITVFLIPVNNTVTDPGFAVGVAKT